MESCFAISVPSEELGLHCCSPHMFNIWVQHEGEWMGLGPFALWQMVDYPNKRTNYFGFPPVPGHCWEQQRAPAATPANSGSAGTVGRSHTLPGVLLTFPLFSLFFSICHCHLVLLLPLGIVSVRTKRPLGTFVLKWCFFLCVVLCLTWFVHDFK